MENENLTPTPLTDEAPLQAPIPKINIENKSSGPLVGTIIVILVFVLGGFFLWSTKIQPQIDKKTEGTTEEQQVVAETAMTNTAVEQLTTQSPSDETSSIEADLKATDIDSLDKSLQNL